jgi:hypothetical protein
VDGVDYDVYSGICMERLRKIMNSSVGIVSVLLEILADIIPELSVFSGVFLRVPTRCGGQSTSQKVLY